MSYDYFYGADGASQYTFFRIPKLLVRGEEFHDISTDAKLLYGLMLDRLQLSIKNRWFDEADRVYIVYTIEDIMDDLNCGNQKAVKILGELEKKAGLIIKKRRGLGKPSVIYVLNFFSGSHRRLEHKDHTVTQNTEETGEAPEKVNVDNVDNVDKKLLKCENHSSENNGIIIRKCEKHISGNVISTSAELCKSQCNKNNQSNTEVSENNPIISIPDSGSEPFSEKTAAQSDGYDLIEERRKYESYLWKKLDMDSLLTTYKYKEHRLREIFDLILDTVTSRSGYIRCAGEDKPAAVVKSQFMKLNMCHIEYVLYCLEENILDIRNIKAYLLTTLYNATLTMDSYYTTKVRYDMAHYTPPQPENREET